MIGRRGFCKAALGLLLAPLGALGVKATPAFRPLTIRREDMRFLKTKHYGLTEIAKAFSMPESALIGVGSGTYSRGEIRRAALWLRQRRDK